MNIHYVFMCIHMADSLSVYLIQSKLSKHGDTKHSNGLIVDTAGCKYNVSMGHLCTLCKRKQQ